MAQEHINESILSEEILEDQKKNRIDQLHQKNLFKLQLMPGFPYSAE